MDWLEAIVKSPAVWSALLLLVNTILKLVWADYSDAVWAATSGLIVALLAALGITGVESVPAKVRRYRTQRAMRETKSAIPR